MNNKFSKELLDQFIENEKKQKMSNIAKQFAIKNNKELYKKKFPTGFSSLDKYLCGGFTAGIHSIGAVSSIGKSTFVIQIAENVAATGTPVIIFSLEMNSKDIVAKSVSRQTYLDYLKMKKSGNSHIFTPKTSEMLQTESIASTFSDEEWDAIINAAEMVTQRTDNINIVDCETETYNADKIVQYIECFVAVHQQYPLVIIDYLQILGAPDKVKNGTDKQIADENIRALKQVSARYELPIILISSFNRENYNKKVSFNSFKESGNIEYSCDTVIGLQLKGIGNKNFDVEAAKEKFPREVEICILKQRYGNAGATITYNFYTRYNYFEEATQIKTNDEMPQKEKRLRF